MINRAKAPSESGDDRGYGIVVDAERHAYTTGGATPHDPRTFGPALKGVGGAFITKYEF